MKFATDGITTGTIYAFKFRAHNSKGFSDYSTMVTIAAVDPPDQPSAPTINYDLSSESSLFIYWVRVADQQSPGGLVTGYSLLMDDGFGGTFSEVFNSVGSSALISEYLVTGVTLSLTYRFKVVAYNFNPTESLDSAITSVQVCAKPRAFARPTKLTTTESSIAINWNEPGYNGGCSITGYAVLVDDGNSGTFIEANVENDSDVRLKPSLSQLLITRL